VKKLILPGAIVALLVLVAVGGPWFTGDTETSHLSQRLLGVGAPGHPLGTDGQGRDVLARLVAGTRPSLVAGLLPVLVAGVLGTGFGIAAGLSFLGLGVAPPHPEWGLMINDLRQYIFTDPALALVPALAIVVVSVTFNVLGDGLRSALNVRGEA
jgi:ABC-type dipeptide/oligopeptide/nickel transport system permease subunit